MGKKLKSTTKICLLNSLPNDIVLKIASSLQVADVCKLSSSSRFWREICESDCIWKALYRKRWPEIVSDHEDSSAHDSQSHQGWRKIYRCKHEEMAIKAASIIKYVEENSRFDTIEINCLEEAIGYLDSEKFGIIDVKLLFLRPEVSVLVNLMGLFYCWLVDGVPLTEESLLEALEMAGISERQVWVKWWMNNQDEGIPRDKLVSLKGLAARYRGGKVVDVFRRGLIGEFPVKISAVNLSPRHGFAKLQTWGNF
ncbi:OLC1v1020323C1 [Oldenlandia corymbosa var. corymbosa]|uniref:OLC1v1020323C1 n=1 Tax=Oldenlandia corymbosa var. corymbosa TaxID=529605 RepID=A0AAV1EGB9_OLDCO|nr:OLC1v1020323C1 [Oldenlandia corymbosa var. corymbosa]